MTQRDIENRLFSLRDEGYAALQSKIVPTIEKNTLIGVRIPVLRKLAKELSKEPSAVCFLSRLPHAYYDENILHALMINEERDFELMTEKLTAFLPFVDNWAVCDTIKPRIPKDRRGEFREMIAKWIASERPYEVRFAIGMLMSHYLDDESAGASLKAVDAVSSGEYYVRMMQAWFFATALAKQYEKAITYLERGLPDPFVMAKTKSKCMDSFRISDERKRYIKSI